MKHHGGFFGWFNRSFERTNHGYTRSVEHVAAAHRALSCWSTWRSSVLMGVLFVTHAQVVPAGRGPGRAVRAR